MNILVLTRCMVHPDNKNNAATNVVLYFAKEWVKQGHRVVMIHTPSVFPSVYYKVPKAISNKFARDGSIPTGVTKELTREENGVLIARMPLKKIVPHGRFFSFQYQNQEKKIIAFLEKADFVPDVITGHWLEPQLELTDRLSKHYSVKKALVVHGKLPDKVDETRKRQILDLNKLFFRSESVYRDSLRKYDFLKPEHCAVCYSGIPDEYLKLYQPRTDWKKSGHLRLAYVGRLTAYKRIDATIRALAKAFPEKNFDFDIIGDGAECEKLKALASDTGLTRQVHFVGRIPRDEVIARMQETDCFVMISENEVFGLVYLEAMAAGCMTVASKDGGIDGVLKDGESGFTCPQGDADALAELLRKIDSLSAEEVNRIRRNAFATAQAFSDSKVAERYLNDILEK